MATHYLSIAALQEPTDFSADDLGRYRVIFNVIATKRPSATFEEELIKILATAGVGTHGTNLFASSQASIPSDDGPYLGLTATGGTGALQTQDRPPSGGYQRPTAQLMTRARNYDDARAMAFAAKDALVDTINVDVTVA